MRIDQLCVRAVVTFVPVVARPVDHRQAISIASLILVAAEAAWHVQLSRLAAQHWPVGQLPSSCTIDRLHSRAICPVGAT